MLLVNTTEVIVVFEQKTSCLSTCAVPTYVDPETNDKVPLELIEYIAVPLAAANS